MTFTLGGARGTCTDAADRLETSRRVPRFRATRGCPRWAWIASPRTAAARAICRTRHDQGATVLLREIACGAVLFMPDTLTRGAEHDGHNRQGGGHNHDDERQPVGQQNPAGLCGSGRADHYRDLDTVEMILPDQQLSGPNRHRQAAEGNHHAPRGFQYGYPFSVRLACSASMAEMCARIG
jgi:hypothetical protein